MQTMPEDIGELTFAQALQILREGWITIAVFAVVLTGAAVALAFMWKPIYLGQVLLAPAGTEDMPGNALTRLAGQFAPLADLVGGNAQQGLDSKDARLATLSSRRLTENFIRERNLLPELFPKQWDSQAQRWKSRNGKPWVPTMDDAVSLFEHKVRRVVEERRTGLVTLSIEWGNPLVAADWANDLVRRANAFLQARAKEEATRSIAFLEGELEKTTVVERRQIIYRLIESRTSQIMMANARAEFAFIVVDPAVPSDPHRFIRPKRTMIVAAGLALGLISGALFVLIRRTARPGTSSQPTR